MKKLILSFVVMLCFTFHSYATVVICAHYAGYPKVCWNAGDCASFVPAANVTVDSCTQAEIESEPDPVIRFVTDPNDPNIVYV